MSFGIVGSVITQTGTDTSLAGLTGLAGVAVGIEGKTSRYNIGGSRLIINGTLTVPNGQQLAMSGDANNDNIDLLINGTLIFGAQQANPVDYSENSRVPMLVEVRNSSADSSGHNGTSTGTGGAGTRPTVSVSATGRLEVYGQTITCSGGIASGIGGVVICEHSRLAFANYYLYGDYSFTSCDLSIEATGAIPTLFAVLAPPVAFADVTVRGSVYLGMSGSTPAGTFSFRDIPRLRTGAHLIGYGPTTAVPGDYIFQAINALEGSDYTVDALAAPSRYYTLQLIREAQFHVVDAAGADIEDAEVQIAGNGSAPVYDGPTDSSGLSSLFSVLLAEAVMNASVATWTYNGVNSDDTDVYSFRVRAYGYLAAYPANQVLKGNSEFLLTQPLLDDLAITEANRATVDAYATIDTLDQLYDRATSWAVANIDAEELATADGSIIDLGSHDLVIDATAASAFAVAGSVITIKAAELGVGSRFTAVKTTGSITTDNGATIASIWEDSTGRHVFVSAPNLISGARVQLLNVDDDIELFNGVLSGAGLLTEVIWTADKTIRLRADHADTLPLEVLGLLSANGATFLSSAADDTVYTDNAIDGSTCTEFEADGVNIQIDIDDPDGVTSVQRLYAWMQWYQTTEEGIASDFFAALTAADSANYEVDQDLADIQLDNVGATPVRFIGGYFKRRDGSTVIASASGSIQMDPGRAYIAPSEASDIADRLLGRSLAGGADGGRTVRDALRTSRNRTALAAGTLTVYQEDDSTPAWTATVTTAPRDALASIDPS